MRFVCGGRNLSILSSSHSTFEWCSRSVEFASVSSYSAFSGPVFKFSKIRGYFVPAVHSVASDHSSRATLWPCLCSISKENVSDQFSSQRTSGSRTMLSIDIKCPWSSVIKLPVFTSEQLLFILKTATRTNERDFWSSLCVCALFCSPPLPP